MTSLVGKWRVAQMPDFNNETERFEWTNVEVLLSRDDADKDTRLMGRMQIVFAEDGTITLLTPIPEEATPEEVDAAVKSGRITLRDGMMLMGENHWKVEGGKNMADTALEGEVMGEKVGPWEELKEIDAETIEMMMFRLRKAK